MSVEPTTVGGSDPSLPADCETVTLGVSFFDLSRMSEWAGSNEDTRVVGFLQAFYALSAKRIESAGGRVVKFLGDAGLAVFPKEAAEDVIFALCGLASEVRELAATYGLDTYLNVNVHVGPVLAGSFGPPGAERYDVLGKTVNIAARLGRRGVTLSAQAFRCLGEEARQRFDKITPPVSYRFRA
jgi:adenylate cyclase